MGIQVYFIQGLGSPLPGGVQIYRQRPEQRMEPHSYLGESIPEPGAVSVKGPRWGCTVLDLLWRPQGGHGDSEWPEEQDTEVR